MYLQSLDIIGFKSFATKTSLHFHRGVTAVVGPNGCGKSNILDAIRWVLGEQSAKALRGGEMADVIFSGTDTRQPYNMAEVSLTFADCEKELGVSWNELRITRRVYRDGKSEYLMNGTTCRLKDIHELFMDTGIGRSAYSIMEQGKLDQILSSRPDDRRAIFEEAAGITKFKSQKKEALRKLEYTEANLLRVTDIIKEVKRQIGSLQRQAGKARRYQALMSDLRVLDTHLSHRTYQQLEYEINELTLSIKKLEEARAEHEEKIASQEQEAALVREQLDGMDRTMEQVRDQAQTLRNRIFSGENRLEMHRERQSELQSMIARASAERDACYARTSEHQEEIAKTEIQLQELLDRLFLEEKLLQEETERALKLQQERAAAERVLEGCLQQLRNKEHRLVELRGKISLENDRRERTQQQLEQVRARQESMEAELLQLQQRAMEATTASTKAQEALAQARHEEEAAQHFYETAQRERQQREQEWNAASKQLTERDAKRELLCQLEREGEGLGEGTQALLRGLNRPDFFQAGILGTLASLITVPQEEIPAIEAALGAASKSVVFKDPDIAEAALKTLQSAAQGRAALLVASLDFSHNSTADANSSVAPVLASSSMSQYTAGLRADAPCSSLPAASSVRTPSEELKIKVEVEDPNTLVALQEELKLEEAINNREAICWASSLISAPEPVRMVVAKLLEGIVIVETIEVAFRLKHLHPELGFATRTGEFLARDGVIYGGSEEAVSTSGLLRRSQIATLEKEIATLRLEESRLNVAREAAATNASEASVRLKEARDSLNQAQMACSTMQGEERLASRQWQEATQRQEVLKKEQTHLETQLEEFQKKHEVNQEEQQRCVLELEKLNQERSTAEAQVVSFRELEQEASAALAEIRLRVATEQQRQQALTQQRTPLQMRLQELAAAATAHEKDLQEKEVRVAQLTLESEELGKSLVKWKEEEAEINQKIADLMKERTGSQEKREALETALRAERKALFELQERRSQEEVRMTELRLRAESLTEKVQRRYQVDLAQFKTDSYLLLKVVTTQKERGQPEETTATEEESVTATLGPKPLEEIPWHKIEASVAELTERVEGMGPVNLEAIAEYEELEERYTFLEQQNNDLINGKKELLETISRINKTTSELFATSFEQIRQNFQETFTELFGGGKANLLLVDDADPLESGIEIIARPPGKQLQSISLLSGGERTMAAVALLFAIYMVKPSPFCVLDEMDAPLDESNIGRFIKLLDRFVDQSQFFVITHNKRTMSRADTLYGVTMEEQGVTKLISVKFSGQTSEQAKPAQAVTTSNE